MRKTLFLFWFLCSISVLSGQNKPAITGKLMDASTHEPMEFANVSVLAAKDLSLITGGISGTDGSFNIPVEPGSYVIRIQFVTYETKDISGIAVSGRNVDLGVISMQPSQKELDEVVVQADRTQMQLTLDKKVYSVGKDLSNLGGSASDMLGNLPSVTVDVEGNVQLRGSTNVQVLIDGKPSGLVGLSSTDALKQLQSNLIESVEIITNPSARYGAQGQAGIINIILKKDKQKGLNGSFQFNTGLPHNHGTSINLNFRRKWVNFFVNYGINYQRAPGKSYTDYTFSDSYSNQLYDRSRGGLSNNIRFGADFDVGERSVLTTSFLYRYSRDLNKTDLDIYDYDANHDLEAYTGRDEDEHETDDNLQYALNYEKKFEREGHKLTADVQFQDNTEHEASDILQSEGTSADEITDVVKQKIDNHQGEDRLMAEADYIRPFGAKAKMEFGYRSTFRTVRNNYVVEQTDADGVYQPLDDYVIHFLYKEYVHALYGIVSDQMNNFSWQAGLRSELSDISSIDKDDADNSRKYDYINLFPSAFLTYKLKSSSQFQLSYSRRINRPSYRDLSPLSSFTNNRTIRYGNPHLQPEYTDSYELGYLQNLDNASIYYGSYYRHTTDVIQRVNEPADANDVVYSMPENLGVQNSYGIELNANKDFGDWYRMQGNFNFYHQRTTGEYNGESLDYQTVTFTTRMSNNFKIKKIVTAQLNIHYEAPQKQTQGKRKSMAAIDLGLSRDIWKTNGTISFSVKDMFNTRKYRYTTVAENYTSYSKWQWRRGPQFILMLSYRLNQKKETVSRDKSPDDYDGNNGF